MKIFNDITGRYIDLPEEPRIVSLAPSNTDTLYQIGAWDLVVGVSLYCRYPREADEKPRVGAYLKVNYRLLDKLKPDIIFTTTGVQRGLNEELVGRGYPVYPLPLPLSHYGILENMSILASILDRIDRAIERIDYYNRILSEIRGRLDYNVYYEIDFMDPYTVGRYSYITFGLKHLGLRNIFADIDSSYFTPSSEQILERDPDVLIFEMNKARPMTLDKLIEWYRDRGLNGLRALREGRVIILDQDTLAHYGPRFIDSLRDLYRMLQGIDD